MNINAPNEDNLCFIKNVLEQGATLIDSPWLFFSFSQEGKLAHTHSQTHTEQCTHSQTEVYPSESPACIFLFMWSNTSFQTQGAIFDQRSYLGEKAVQIVKQYCKLCIKINVM